MKECKIPEQCSCAPVVRIDWHSSSFSTDVEIGRKTQRAIYACSCRGIPVAWRACLLWLYSVFPAL